MAARLCLGVAAVLLEVQRDQRLDRSALVVVEVATGDEVIGHRAGLVAGPGVEGGDELALVDQADSEARAARRAGRAMGRENAALLSPSDRGV